MALLLSTLGAVLVALGGFGAAKSTKHKHRWVAASLIGALLNIGSTWVSADARDRADAARQAQADKLEAAQSESLRLSRELENYTKGTGSFPYFSPTVSSRNHAAFASLLNEGKYPLYDVKIRIVPDPERMPFPQKDGPASYDILTAMFKAERRLDAGTVGLAANGVAYPWLTTHFDLGAAETHRSYNIFFNTRSDYFTQYLRFARVGARWFVAFRVVRSLGGSDGQTFKECVQNGFPTDALDWKPARLDPCGQAIKTAQ